MICDLTDCFQEFLNNAYWLIGAEDQDNGGYFSFVKYMKKLIDTSEYYPTIRKIIIYIDTSSFRPSDYFIIDDEKESTDIDLAKLKEVFPNLIKISMSSDILYVSEQGRYINKRFANLLLTRQINAIHKLLSSVNIDFKIK